MKSTKLINIGILLTYNSKNKKMELLKNVDLVIEKNKIKEIGSNLGSADKLIDCKNCLVTPGFVDPHTHPVFLKPRKREVLKRLDGYTYEEINNSGGGINDSIDDVRLSTEKQLFNKVKSRMDQFLSLGTTTIECKSGYGLDLNSELKSLSIIGSVNQSHKIDMVATFMGAHAFPREYRDNKDGYVKLICEKMIPAVSKQGIAKFNDVFCEKGFFNENQSIKILTVGKKYGLIPRIHADELSNSNGAKVANIVGAISADHLMKVNKKGIEYLSNSNTICILLPGTTFYLGKKSYAPYNKLRDANIEIALATDFNPGSCYIKSIPFVISLACFYLKMTVEEAIKSVTFNSAKSLMLDSEVGSLEKNKKADIIIWKISDPVEIPMNISNQIISKVIKNGSVVFKS